MSTDSLRPQVKRETQVILDRLRNRFPAQPDKSLSLNPRKPNNVSDTAKSRNEVPAAMNKGAKWFRFEWERQVISNRGPTKSTTRLVLLALATYVNKERIAWPTTLQLAEATALSERAVCTHLKKAVNEGWIERTASKRKGKDWKNYTYRIVIPPVGTEPRSVANPAVGAESDARATEPCALAAEPDDNLALNDVQSNNVMNTIDNNSVNKSAVDFKERSIEQFKNTTQWANEFGMTENAGEHPGAFQVRVAQAVEKHKAGLIFAGNNQ